MQMGFEEARRLEPAAGWQLQECKQVGMPCLEPFAQACLNCFLCPPSCQQVQGSQAGLALLLQLGSIRLGHRTPGSRACERGSGQGRE